jgi:hypothetical protein
VRSRLRALGQSHLNSTSACALDLNSSMPFCFDLITRIVLPRAAQNSDASSNAACRTPKPFLSQHICDSDRRYVSRPDGASAEVVEHPTQQAVSRHRKVGLVTPCSRRALRPDRQFHDKNQLLFKSSLAARAHYHTVIVGREWSCREDDRTARHPAPARRAARRKSRRQPPMLITREAVARSGGAWHAGARLASANPRRDLFRAPGRP